MDIIAGGLELALHCGGQVAGVGDDNTLWWMNCQSYMGVEVPEVTRCRSYFGHQNSQVLRESKRQRSQIVGVDEMSGWS